MPGPANTLRHLYAEQFIDEETNTPAEMPKQFCDRCGCLIEGDAEPGTMCWDEFLLKAGA